MFVHLFCFLLIPHINEIIDHLSFSKLCHLAWYSLGPSMLLQMARFQWFLWPSNVSLYVYCAVLFLVIQLCPILCDTVDCSLPGSSVHGDSPGNNTGVGCHVLLQGFFPTQGWKLCLLHCRQILYHWATGKDHIHNTCLKSYTITTVVQIIDLKSYMIVTIITPP